MKNGTILEELNKKITEILQKYKEIKDENMVLQSKIASLKVACEIKDTEIKKLIDESAQKEKEIEQIVDKIESIMG